MRKFEYLDQKNIIDIQIQKSKIPIIFLDSNIIIELFKASQKKSEINPFSILLNNIKELTSKNKLLVPLGIQQDEISRNGTSEIVKFYKDIFNTSDFKYPTQIEEDQMLIMFSEFINKSETLTIDYKTIFNDNTTKKPPFRIIFSNDNSINSQILKDKKIISRGINEISKTENRTKKYENQFLAESLTYGRILYNTIELIVKNDIKNVSNTGNRLLEIFSKQIPYKTVNDTFVRNASQVLEFLFSNYYTQSPYSFINSAILTEIMYHFKYKDSDFYDVKNMASIYPFVDFYVTDKIMATIADNLDLHSKYGTKHFCTNNLASLNEILSKM